EEIRRREDGNRQAGGGLPKAVRRAQRARRPVRHVGGLPLRLAGALRRDGVDEEALAARRRLHLHVLRRSLRAGRIPRMEPPSRFPGPRALLTFRDNLLPSQSPEEDSIRTTVTNGSLTVRAIAGTYNVLIGIDLDKSKRAGCLGFTMSRTNVATNETRFLPNRITFPSTPENTKLDTSNSPLQKFRW